MDANSIGPVLAEQEMLHDGEPVFALSWGPGPVPDPHAGHRRGSALSISALNLVFSDAAETTGPGTDYPSDLSPTARQCSRLMPNHNTGDPSTVTPRPGLSGVTAVDHGSSGRPVGVKVRE